MKHEMRLHREPFDQIKSGIKIFEARIYDEKRRSMHAGDTITFKLREHESVSFEAEIADIKVYPSFVLMFEAISPVEFGWDDTDTPQTASDGLRKYYSEDEEKEFGVVAIQLRLIHSPASGLYYA